MVFVYVIRSLANGKRYVGITAKLGQRMRSHSKKQTKGGQMLGQFALIHQEPFANYTHARGREKFLKSGKGRTWLDDRFGRAGEHTAIDTPAPSPTVSGSSSGV